MKTFIFLSMIFMHVIADFNLQGMLGDLKQLRWWEMNYPDNMYRNDYRAALYIHSFSWAFLVMLPIAVYMNFEINPLFCFTFAFNVICHTIIDDMKANFLAINLSADQLMHIIQIAVTFLALVVI